MLKVTAEKLFAVVVGIADLGTQFPGVASFNDRIGLDVRVEQGSLAVGKKVRLTGPRGNEEVAIVGIEMSGVLRDPSLVRVVCSKPSTISVPSGPVSDWHIAEQ
jgi:hypothetical protein